MIEVSVIVPVYNVEPYLEQCLDSLVNQTMSEIEIIIVNDGSTDNSQKIIDRYAEKYAQIRAFTKENGGVSDARNYGLEHASGKYIGFIDSDDFVKTDMYEKLYKKAEQGHYDIVECDLIHYWPDHTSVEVGERIQDRQKMLMDGRSVVWNRLVNREWLLSTGIKFKKDKIYEDVEYCLKLIPFIRSMGYVNEGLIYYRQRENSLNTSYTARTMDIFDVLESIRTFYIEHDFYHAFEEAIEYIYVRILLGSSFKRMAQIKNSTDRKKALLASWKLLNDRYPNWKKNKFLAKMSGIKALYIRSNNYATYRLYMILAPLFFSLKRRKGE